MMHFFSCLWRPVDILKIDTYSAVVHVSMDANMKMMSALAVDNNITCQNLTLNKHILSNGDGIQMIVYRMRGHFSSASPSVGMVAML